MNRGQTLTVQLDHRRAAMGRRIPAQVLEAKDHAVLKNNQVVVMPWMYVHSPQHVPLRAHKIPLNGRRAVVPRGTKQLRQLTPMIGMCRELAPEDAMGKHRIFRSN